MKDAVHPAISVVIALWFGLCVGLTIWLLHPGGSDAFSVAYTLLLFYLGAVIAKHTALRVLTIVEKLQRRS